MNEEQKQKDAWAQMIAEDWMVEMNLLSPELLNRIRMMMMIIYPINSVDIECNTNAYTMNFKIKFNWWKSFWKKNKIRKELNRKLLEKFPAYKIELQEL